MEIDWNIVMRFIYSTLLSIIGGSVYYGARLLGFIRKEYRQDMHEVKELIKVGNERMNRHLESHPPKMAGGADGME